MRPQYKIGELLICPVCGKEFKATSSTKYYCNGGYACGWTCFLKHTKETDKLKAQEKSKLVQEILNNKK